MPISFSSASIQTHLHARAHATPHRSAPALLDRIIHGCLYALVFLLPLFFFTSTLDALEWPKQTLLFVLVGVAALAWIVKIVYERELTLSRSWLHVMVLAFVAGYLVLSIVSQDRLLSFFGSAGQVSWAFTTVFVLALFYLIATTAVRTTTHVYHLILAFLLSSFLAGLFGLLQLFGWYADPAAVTHTAGFTTVGSAFALAMFLTVPLVISSTLIFHGCRDKTCLLGRESSLSKAAKALVWATLIVSLVVLLLVDYGAAWGAVLVGMVTMVALEWIRSRKRRQSVDLLVPGLIVAVSILLLVFHLPWHLNVPAEISPSNRASFDIARQTLATHPIGGSGPSTWIENYAKFRSPLVNASPFWNIRFDRGISFFLTGLATLGLFGMGLWLAMVLLIGLRSATQLIYEKNDEAWYAFALAFSAWVTIVFLSFVYNYSLTHLFVFWLLSALLVSLTASDTIVIGARGGHAWKGLIISLTVIGILIVSGLWVTGERWVAEAAFSKGITMFREGATPDQFLPKIEWAHALNPWSDAYVRNLSEAHLMRAVRFIQTHPTPDQFAHVQDDVKTAVDLGRQATTMAPENVDNWANLALIYQSIAGFTRGADEFAVAAYREAEVREPQNPVFPAEVGHLFLLRVDAYRSLLTAQDQKTRTDAQQNLNLSLQAATQSLRASITIKPDYLPAHYYLGAVYERQGQLPEAIGELEKVLSVNTHDVGVAFELAILYERHNEKTRALNLMTQIVKADPNNANPRWYLSAMEEEAGQLDQAIANMQTLATQLPNNVAVTQKLAALQRAKAARIGQNILPLPEPLRQDVQSPSDGNSLK